jgi:hypothetical protein
MVPETQNTVWSLINDLETKKGISEIVINDQKTVFVAIFIFLFINLSLYLFIFKLQLFNFIIDTFNQTNFSKVLRNWIYEEVVNENRKLDN